MRPPAAKRYKVNSAGELRSHPTIGGGGGGGVRYGDSVWSESHHSLYGTNIRFVGNGFCLYKDQTKKIFDVLSKNVLMLLRKL